MADSRTEQTSVWSNLRRLLAFQIKLALDAARDFALSPISIAAFLIDLVWRPVPEKSLYRRLMLLGQRSDRVINLFDQHSDSEHYTVDETLRDVEKAAAKGIASRRPQKP